MNFEESTILATIRNHNDHAENICRLIEIPVSDGSVYSVFETTHIGDEVDECFVYDIARREEDARAFLKRIDDGKVSTYTLRDVARDFILESLILL